MKNSTTIFFPFLLLTIIITMKTLEDQLQTEKDFFSKNPGIISNAYINKNFDGSKLGDMEYRPYVVDVPSFPIDDPIEAPNKEPPKDKWQALRIILIIQGLATLMPWNMFINAQSYFQDYKLMTTSNSTEMEKHYHDSFMSYVTVCSMIPSVSFSAINVIITRSSMASPMRMTVGKLVMILLLVVTIVLAAIDTSEHVVTFFIVTMVTIVLINAASSIFQNSLFGICSILPRRFITAVIFGSNSAGVITSISSIISIAISSNTKTSALFYFSTAILILIIALITNKIFQRLPLYLYYKKQLLNESDHEEKKSSRPQFWKIFKKIWMMCINLWLTMTITIFNFPNIVSAVTRINFPIEDIYWIPVFCFLNFNIFAVIGTLPANWTVWPGPKSMWVVVLVRTLIFGPFFILSNYLPDGRVMPTYFANDYVYIVAIMALAFTNSHLMNVCFIHTPSLLDENESAVGGMILNIFLFLGILSGGLISFSTKLLVNCC